MATEIERKFLVKTEAFMNQTIKHYFIKQGFLNSHKDRTVRVRLKEDQGYLTVKGKSTKDGLLRFEWETEIGKADAEKLLSLCETGIIEKVRYEVPVGKHVFEVDVFEGSNYGLVIAELELEHESDTFSRPDWLGEEVTGDIRYYNSQLISNPFQQW